MEEPRYKRVLLKISGEALAGERHFGLDFDVIGRVCDAVKEAVDMGVQVGVVVGGGNFWRGVKDGGGKMERSRADQMGMLATVLNSLAVQEVLEQQGQGAQVLTSFPMGPVAQPYSYATADRYLKEGQVVIFAGGTGNPYFTTDTTAALRACELDVDCVMKATKVDGVYDADPTTHPDAKRFDRISYMDVLSRGLNVMDATATSLCMDNDVPMIVFDLTKPGNIRAALQGEPVGTVVE